MANHATKNTTPEEVIAIIRKCAAELGHVPSMNELLRLSKMHKSLVRQYFGSYVKALEACGLERHGCGYRVEMLDLFLDWAGIVRQLGKVPSMLEYQLRAKYSTKPLATRYGGWKYVLPGLIAYAREARLEDEWKDVLEIAVRSLNAPPPTARTSLHRRNPLPRPRKLADEPVYGPPMAWTPMAFCPTNEAGVAVLFGAMARGLGFAITRVQTEFPDCEAMREVEPDRLQRRRIEFEYESRNFLTHLHPVDGCDLIVCWKHNWPECPLEVLELKEAISGQHSAIS